MNVIFLDFDGVLDTYMNQSYEQIENKIKILADIAHTYNCKIVIEAACKTAIDEETLEFNPESTWLSFLFYMFNKYNIDVIGRTPSVEKKINEYSFLSMWKEDEIIAYLMKHPEIDHFCVIDDDDRRAMNMDSDLEKLKDFLITTKDYLHDADKEGLLLEHKEEVGKILKKVNTFKNNKTH